MTSNPDRGGPAPETPQPSKAAAEEAPASRPDEGKPPLEPPTMAARQRHYGRLWNPLLWKNILTPIILIPAVIGGGSLIGASVLYSPPGELVAPSFTTLEFTSTFAFRDIHYVVSQVSPSIAEIDVAVGLNSLRPPAKAPAATLVMFPPPGITFRTCPIRFCAFDRSQKQASWSQDLAFEPTRNFAGEGDNVGAAFAAFFVRASNFGFASNGVTATAAIPQVFYTGPGSPLLVTQYANAPLASSYDWSGFPTVFANATEAFWDEPITGGAAPGKVAVGINQSNQTRDFNKTFFAGALLGLGGAAILSAVQEALHVFFQGEHRHKSSE
jgi:hypothetical protein